MAEESESRARTARARGEVAEVLAGAERRIQAAAGVARTVSKVVSAVADEGPQELSIVVEEPSLRTDVAPIHRKFTLFHYG